MQTEAQRRNSLRLLVARVRDRRLERLMLRLRRQRERAQNRSRKRLFAEAQIIARDRRSGSVA